MRIVLCLLALFALSAAAIADEPKPDPPLANTYWKLVTADGSVYKIVGDYAANDNAKLIPMLSVPVEATGEVTEKDGAKELKITAMKKAS